MRRTRTAAVAAVVALVGLCIAPAAGAAPPAKSKIIENVGAGGVKLGMTEAAVKRKWGRPNSRACGAIGGTPLRSCHWQRGRGQRSMSLIAIFRAKRLVYLRIAGDLPGWKTTKGVGLTAKLSRIRRAYRRGLRLTRTCVLDRGYVAEIGGKRGRTSFWFETPDSTESRGARAIVVYNPSRADWDGGHLGGGPGRGCGTGSSPPGDNPPPPPPPVDDTPPDPEPEPEPKPEPEPDDEE